MDQIVVVKMHDFKGKMAHGTSRFRQMLHLKFNTELNFLYSPTLFLRTKTDKIKLYVYMHMHFDRERFKFSIYVHQCHY